MYQLNDLHVYLVWFCITRIACVYNILLSFLNFSQIIKNYLFGMMSISATKLETVKLAYLHN